MKISPIIFLASLPIAAIAINTISSSAQDSRPMDSAPIQVSLSVSSWPMMNSAEEAETWDDILKSPLAIAALNQLAIEGFISPICQKTFYLNQEVGVFQSLLRVKCRDPQ